MNFDRPQTVRSIVARTKGSRHGPIVRLMSPGDLGRSLKPFVFLDLFDLDGAALGQMGLHPHSGIATVTVLTLGETRFDDPSGIGRIGYGGVEWMRAGGGVWHGKEMSAEPSVRVQGFQLWLALPREEENGPGESQYLEAREMPVDGPATVIVGRSGDARSPVHAPEGINYFLVTLKPGERWTYQPPAEQSVAWLALAGGSLNAGEPVTAGEMVVFEHGSTPISVEAGGNADAVFVIGSAVPHPHDLVLGHYSVHTSGDALRLGEARIAELATQIAREEGRARKSGAIPVYR